jgi:hypothetical protein
VAEVARHHQRPRAGIGKQVQGQSCERPEPKVEAARGRRAARARGLERDDVGPSLQATEQVVVVLEDIGPIDAEKQAGADSGGVHTDANVAQGGRRVVDLAAAQAMPSYAGGLSNQGPRVEVEDRCSNVHAPLECTQGSGVTRVATKITDAAGELAGRAEIAVNAAVRARPVEAVKDAVK